MIKKISAEEFQNEAMKDERAVIDFSATWCGPCKMLGPVIADISEELTDAKFYNVDVDDAQELAMKYGIMSVPTVLILKNGEEAGRLVGFQPKEIMKQAIQEKLGQ